jgi:hypothetical protein
LAALVPLAIGYLLISGQVKEQSQSAVLFACAAVLAWTALNQFPYASPIYFSYTTPLAVVAGVALASCTGTLGRPPMLAWALMVLVFAVLSTNRSYVQELGLIHVPRHFDTGLNLPRAHLLLERNQAAVYQDTISLIEQHLTSGPFIAGPDSPELFYLVGTENHSGTLFDFFTGSDLSSTEHEWESGQVIVINHKPAFSDAPSPDMLADLRKDFPAGRQIGRFEVRWR